MSSSSRIFKKPKRPHFLPRSARLLLDFLCSVSPCSKRESKFGLGEYHQSAVTPDCEIAGNCVSCCHADSDQTEAVREIPKRNEANSLGAKKRIGAPRVGIQRAAQD